MTPPKDGTCLKELGSLGPNTSNNIDLKKAGLISIKSDVPDTAFHICCDKNEREKMGGQRREKGRYKGEEC